MWLINPRRRTLCSVCMLMAHSLHSSLSMSFSQTKQPSTSPEACHRALDVDDVLFLILEHLLLPSTDSLLSFAKFDHPASQGVPLFQLPCTPLLVCRRWYNIGSQVALHSATLRPEIWLFDHHRFPKPLHHVSRLHYVFPSSTTPEELDEFARLASHLDAASLTTSLAARPRLRELWLSNVPEDVGYMLPLPNLSQRNKITLLKASASVFYTHLPQWDTLLSVVASSPFSPDALCLPHLKHLLLEGGRIDRLPEAWSPNTPIRLTTLSLCHVLIGATETLRALLLGVASPSLERLSVTHTYHYLRDVFTKDFLLQWAPLCSNLRWIQFDGVRDCFMIVMVLADYFPLAERIESTYRDSSELNTPMAISHKLTRFEVACEGRDRGFATLRLSDEIHDFLCSQAATHLQELILPGLFCPTETLDPSLYELTLATSQVSSAPLWSCSSLTTLIMSAGATSSCYGFDDLPLDSRVIYGFIAANCPGLRSLDLRLSGTAFDLDPEGGLCFLGRLSRLEHLTIRASGYQRPCKGFLSRERYAPWPYNMAFDRNLVQRSSLLAQMSRLFGRKRVLVPVLRWLAVDPTEVDRERNLTNLRRCDYLLNTVMENDFAQNKARFEQVVRPPWRVRLQTMLKDAKSQMREGSCWQQLKTFHCHLVSAKFRDDPVPDKKELNFIACYKEALQQVLPHVDVAIYSTFRAD